LPREAWTVFQDSSKPALVESSEPAGTRYRLAGTFLSFLANQEDEEIRKAIIDDAGGKTQVLVQEGDELSSYKVETIRRDSVVLRNRAGESLELTLSFSTGPSSTQAKKPSILKPKTFEDMPALETSRFGKRIGDNRWVLQREALIAYYEELLDEPARMASLFASLPDFTEEGSLKGFRVQIAGEKELFDAMGLKEGDIIREVNSIRMTSSRRSEYLVREFIQGRLNAVVFDVDRDGERQKLIELIR
jgi:type II secretory pathway component PulC